MKIVITVEQFHPENWYLEHYLARELTNLGHDVHVFTFADNISTRTFEPDYQVHRLASIGTIKPYHLPSIGSLAHIVEFVEDVEPDVIHCQPLFSPLSLTFMQLGRMGHHEVVGSVLSGPFSVNSTASALKFVLTKIVVSHYVMPRTKMFFAKSTGLASLIHRMFGIPLDRITVVPLGSDQSYFSHNELIRNRIRQSLGISSDEIVVLCSGKIAPSKHIDELLRACEPLVRENGRIRVLILGDGERGYVESMQALCRTLGLSDNVDFHPFVDRRDLPGFFDACDLAVWPGGASISMVDAASMGLPLISMKSPVEEYALSNRNGLFYRQGDIEGLRKCLGTLISDDELRVEMGRRSRHLVESRLNWQVIANQYADYYKRALE